MVTLNPLPAGVGSWFNNFQISPDSSRVFFRLDGPALAFRDLYSVPISGGSLVRLNTPGGIVRTYRIAPDGSRLVYQADADIPDVDELYSAPVDGGSAAVKLNPNLSACCSTLGFDITADSSRVVYIADQDTAGTTELYSVPIEGGSVTKLNHALIGGDYVLDFRLTSQWVVYRSFVTSFGINEAYGYRALASGPPGNGETIWSNVTTSGILDYRITADQQSILLRGRGRSGLGSADLVTRLWLARLTGTISSSTARELVQISWLVPGGGVDDFAEGASGFFVYRADQDIEFKSEIYSVGPGIFSDGFEQSN